MKRVGPLCRNRHEHLRSGGSLRYLNGRCVACVAAVNKKARRQRALTAPPLEDGPHVVCLLCGTKAKRLGRHLSADHALSSEEYRARFPEALVDVPGTRTRSAACRAKMSEAAIRRWSDPEKRRVQSERTKISAAPRRGKALTIEHREKISQGGRGKIHNLSPEGRRIKGENGRKALNEIRQRPGYSAKLAAGVQRRITRGEKIGLMNEDTRAKSFASRLRNGTLVPQGGGRGVCGWRKGISHFCRSTLEANFARIMLFEGVPYEHEPRLFRLPSGRHYLPDFRLLQAWRFLPEGWVELRGWRNADGSLAGDRDDKIREFEATEGVSVFVLAQTDALWDTLIAEFKSRIPLWEIPRRNLKTHPEIFGISRAA